MTVKELIDELKEFDENLPICIDDYMGFVETTEKCIKVERKQYICFPFTDNDKFNYINLTGTKGEY